MVVLPLMQMHSVSSEAHESSSLLDMITINANSVAKCPRTFPVALLRLLCDPALETVDALTNSMHSKCSLREDSHVGGFVDNPSAFVSFPTPKNAQRSAYLLRPGCV